MIRSNEIIYVLDQISNNYFSLLSLSVSVVAVIYARNAFKNSQQQLEEQKESGKIQANLTRVSMAWDILSRRVLGSGGKSDAIEFLANNAIPLSGVSLSVILTKDEMNAGHKFGVNLTGLNLSEKNVSNGLRDKGHWFNVELMASVFSGSFLEKAFFEYVRLGRSSFKESFLGDVKFKNCSLDGVDFTHIKYIIGSEPIFEDCFIILDKNSTLEDINKELPKVSAQKSSEKWEVRWNKKIEKFSNSSEAKFFLEIKKQTH